MITFREKPNAEIEALIDSNTEFILDWEWEWFATLTFPDEDKFKKLPAIDKRVKWWIRTICKTGKIQVGAYYVISHKNGVSHVHMLMLGSGKQGEPNLTDNRLISIEGCQRLWGYRSDIQEINVIPNVAGYLSSHFRPCKSNWFEHGFYNTKLLKKTKIRCEY